MTAKKIDMTDAKQVIHVLVRAAIECGAIERGEGEFLRRTDPYFALKKLVDLSGHATNGRLWRVVQKYDRQIIQITCNSNELTSFTRELLEEMAELIKHFDQGLRQASEYRRCIDPDNLKALFRNSSETALERESITDRNILDKVIEAESISFARFAEHALQFTPVVDPDHDPSTGPKSWMTGDKQSRDDWALAPVSYQWPAEADFITNHEQCNCDEQTLRTALMCLQNPCLGRRYFERKEFPFATVEGRLHEGWPHWPPEHGPCVMQPPGDLYEFLWAVKIGAGLVDGPTELKSDEDSVRGF